MNKQTVKDVILGSLAIALILLSNDYNLALLGL